MCPYKLSAAVTATTISTVCRNCGIIGKSGKGSCCGPGGSWFKNCGGAGNAKLLHTWYEGTKACETRARPQRARGQQINNAAQRLKFSTRNPKTVVITAAKVFALSSTDSSLKKASVNTSLDKSTAAPEPIYAEEYDTDETTFASITLTPRNTAMSNAANISHPSTLGNLIASAITDTFVTSAMAAPTVKKGVISKWTSPGIHHPPRYYMCVNSYLIFDII